MNVKTLLSGLKKKKKSPLEMVKSSIKTMKMPVVFNKKNRKKLAALPIVTMVRPKKKKILTLPWRKTKVSRPVAVFHRLKAMAS